MRSTAKNITYAPRATASLEVYNKILANKNCLYFEYDGFVSIEAIKSVKERLEYESITDSKEKHTVVIDCLKVTDYDCQSRNLLQDILVATKDSINSLWVITESLTIHAALEILSFFADVEIKVVRDVQQLEKRLYHN